MPSTWSATAIDRRDEYASPCGNPTSPDTIAEFGDRYDVHTTFIPFESRDYSPLERYRMVREFVDDLRELKPAFTSTEITEYYDIDDGQTLAGLADIYYYAAGCRPLDRSAHKDRKRYANPEYVHLQTLEPVTVDAPTRTVELARAFAGTGLHSLGDIADYFARPRRRLSRHLQALLAGRSYSDLRDAGRRRMARTFAIINEWGRTCREIGDVFGMPLDTVNGWINKYALDGGFQVPDDPTSPHGYRYVEEHGEFRNQNQNEIESAAGGQAVRADGGKS